MLSVAEYFAMSKGKRETGVSPVRTRHCDCGVKQFFAKRNLREVTGIVTGKALLFHEDASVRKPAVLLVRKL